MIDSGHETYYSNRPEQRECLFECVSHMQQMNRYGDEYRRKLESLSSPSYGDAVENEQHIDCIQSRE